MANTYTDLLKLRMPALGDIGWDDEVNDNTEIFEFTVAPVLKGNRIVSGLAPSDGGGLDIDVAGGTVVVDGAVYTLSSDTKTCTASSKNYLFVDDTGTLNATTTMPTGSFTAIGIIDTDITSIVRFSDARAMAQGALALAIDYTPNYYALDTGEDEAIYQHLAGIDNQIGFMAGFENFLINPFFDFWQRGITVSLTGSAIYGPDRWCCRDIASVGASAMSWSRQSFTPGQTDVPGNPKYFARLNVTGATGENFIDQRIESLSVTAGKKVVYYIYIKSDSITSIDVKYYRYFGSGGSTTDNATISTETISSTWTKITATFTMPSLSGKTIGTGDFLFLRINWTATGTYYVDIATAKFQEGEKIIPLVKRPNPVELLLCQRYCESSYNTDVALGTTAAIGNGGFESLMASVWLFNNPVVSFKTRKRSTPTITLYSLYTANNPGYISEYNTLSTFVAERPYLINVAKESHFRLQSSDGAFTAGNIGTGHWIATAEL